MQDYQIGFNDFNIKIKKQDWNKICFKYHKGDILSQKGKYPWKNSCFYTDQDNKIIMKRWSYIKKKIKQNNFLCKNCKYYFQNEIKELNKSKKF